MTPDQIEAEMKALSQFELEQVIQAEEHPDALPLEMIEEDPSDKASENHPCSENYESFKRSTMDPTTIQEAFLEGEDDEVELTTTRVSFAGNGVLNVESPADEKEVWAGNDWTGPLLDPALSTEQNKDIQDRNTTEETNILEEKEPHLFDDTHVFIEYLKQEIPVRYRTPDRPTMETMEVIVFTEQEIVYFSPTSKRYKYKESYYDKFTNEFLFERYKFDGQVFGDGEVKA